MVKREYPDAWLLNPNDVRVIFLTAFGLQKCHKYAVSIDPKVYKIQKNSRNEELVIAIFFKNKVGNT